MTEMRRQFESQLAAVSAQRDRMVEALEAIEEASHTFMMSRDDCGRIAKEALERFKEP